MPSRRSSKPEQLGLSFPVEGLIAGVDEAGRGPLAGPVVAAAVILDDTKRIRGLNDSKQLTPLARDRLYDQIRDKALCCAVGEASVEEIDTLNILQATLLAMRRAVEGLRLKPAKVHRDRMLLQLHELHPQYGFDAHKGYSTPQHLAALKQHGACAIHRRSFAPVREALGIIDLTG